MLILYHVKVCVIYVLLPTFLGFKGLIKSFIRFLKAALVVAAHLRHQQGEFPQPVVEVVAVGQTGLHCGRAVSPAHQQPHGVVCNCQETKVRVSKEDFQSL